MKGLEILNLRSPVPESTLDAMLFKFQTLLSDSSSELNFQKITSSNQANNNNLQDEE